MKQDIPLIRPHLLGCHPVLLNLSESNLPMKPPEVLQKLPTRTPSAAGRSAAGQQILGFAPSPRGGFALSEYQIRMTKDTTKVHR
jgi:hypothetical protein